jgi:hypothetical protein
MSDLQARLTAVTQSAARLVAELSELDRLREQVRKAQLFRSGNHGVRKGQKGHGAVPRSSFKINRGRAFSQHW